MRKQCLSLSKRTTLTYEREVNGAGQPTLRLVGNSGPGLFNTTAIAIDDIHALIGDQGVINTVSLRPLYPQRSLNSAGFLLAVLCHEGYVSKHPHQAYAYVWRPTCS